MTVIPRSALESSTLADLHEIASELGLDGFRRLRKAALIAAIIERQGGEPDEPAVEAEVETEPAADADADAGADAPAEAAERPARRSRRGGRGRGRARDRDNGEIEVGEVEPELEAPPARRERGAAVEDRIVAGVVELMPNGSGFVRVAPPEASDDDVYISAAQVRRCELVAGDAVSGPVRTPRRSERYPSLIRVDTINGRAADEVAEGTKYDELPCTWASERIALGDEDATLKAIEWLTPFGRGSRVVIVGGPRAGKTEALRRLAVALTRQEELECSVVLTGARPEELGDWRAADVAPAVELCLGAASDVQAQAIDRAIETGRRVAARGGHAVVLIDSLEQLPAPAARRVLAAARKIVDGGSLTVVATAREPFGGETTVIALDALLTAAGRLPALDLTASGTLRPELLVGEKGAEAIAEARAAALR